MRSENACLPVDAGQSAHPHCGRWHAPGELPSTRTFELVVHSLDIAAAVPDVNRQSSATSC